LEVIRADSQQASRRDIPGTPVFYVGPVRLEGIPANDVFEAAIVKQLGIPTRSRRCAEITVPPLGGSAALLWTFNICNEGSLGFSTNLAGRIFQSYWLFFLSAWLKSSCSNADDMRSISALAMRCVSKPRLSILRSLEQPVLLSAVPGLLPGQNTQPPP
jgi:hypothetical protein